MLMAQPKFKIDDTAFVMGYVEVIVNNVLCHIPLGTPVKVRSISVLANKGFTPSVRYQVGFSGAPLVCWLDEGVLSSRLLEVA